MILTKGFVNSCRNIGALRDFLCQAIDQVDALTENQRWRKYPDEKIDVKVDECVSLLVVVEVQDDDKYRYVTEAEYVLENGEIPEGVFYRPYIGDEIEEDFVKADGKRYISKVIMWRPMPKAPEDGK